MKKELSEETVKTGGYSRKWMDAYKALINKRNTLQEIPKELIDEKMEFFIKGYEEACKIFEDYATNRLK